MNINNLESRIKYFQKLKRENRGGNLICMNCNCLKYMTQKHIQKNNNIICKDCFSKKKKKRKSTKRKVKFNKKWSEMNITDKKRVFALIKDGYKYKEISEILLIEPKELYQAINREKNKNSIRRILQTKINSFCRKSKQHLFNVDELIEKIGDNPRCYISGDLIDLSKKETFSLDHIIPISKGGDDSLENCGLTTKESNMIKHNLNINELVILCKKIINNNLAR